MISAVFLFGESQTFMGGLDSPLDGQVNAIVTNGSTVYLGGTFTKIGYACGTGVLLDTGTAKPIRAFPKCDPLGSQVLASVPDGMGGFYIGGQFLYINGVARKYLAHIRADNSLDPWDPQPNAWVATLSLTGNRLYAGGVFTSVGGQSRGYAAAFDTTTGSLLPWDPRADNEVTAIQQVGSIVYLGGYFFDLNSQLRQLIGSVDASAGNVTAWAPTNAGPSGSFHVTQFIYSGGYLYACGMFSLINSVARFTIVRMDGAGNVDLGWNPGSTINGGAATVTSMAIAGNTLFVGGSFTAIGGKTVSHVAAIDVATGLATTWNANPNNNVTSLAVVGDKLFVGGNFSSIGGKSVSYLAKLDTATGLASTWDAKITSTPWTLSTNGTSVFAGGQFTTAGNTVRNSLAAISLTTGLLTPWNPSATGGGVNALALAGDKLIAGGGFTFIGGSHSIPYLVALDTLTGSPIVNPSWKATANSTVYALEVVGTRLYIGGYFTTIGGTGRNYLAAVDVHDGTPNVWNPNLNSGVFVIAYSGSKVFVSGGFTLVGATTRNYAAAFDTVTDALTAWDPAPDNYCRAMAVQGSRVYLGGSYFNVNSQPMKSLSAVDTATGTLVPGFDAHFTLAYDVNAIAAADTQIIIGGNFGAINGKTRSALAYLNASTGAVSSWGSNINNDVGSGVVYAIALELNTIFVGGQIASLMYYPQSTFGVMTDPTITVLPVELTTFSAGINQGNAVLLWHTATEVNNYGFEVQRRTINAPEWNRIGFVGGAGTSNSPRTYSFVDKNPPAGAYGYRLKQIDRNGSFSYSEVLEVSVNVPGKLALSQNYPNPFNPSTTVSFSIPFKSVISLKVFDLLGKEVATIYSGELSPGNYTRQWNASDLTSGVYFYRIQAGSFSQTKKLVLLK